MPFAQCLFKFGYEVHILSLVWWRASRDANLTDTDKAKILHAAKTAAARISVKRVLTGSAVHVEKGDSTGK